VRIICTGISGTGRLEWLRQVVALARERNRDVALYDVTETMFEIGRAVGEPVEEETILDMFPRALVLLRAAALEQICSAIQSDPARDWVLNTHAVFRWKNTLISGFDPHYLERLNPHLFVTVTIGART
jgi:adenylate kinase